MFRYDSFLSRETGTPPPGPDMLEDLFSSGEVGDWWRFDADNTDATAVDDAIRTATGIVNGRTLIEQDSSHVPLLKLRSGVQVARFDGSADRLYHNFGVTVSQPATIILCVYDADTDTHVLLTGNSATSRFQISNGGSGDVVMFASATLDTTLNEGFGLGLLTAVFNGASSLFRKDGVELATGNVGSYSTNRLTLGALYDGTFGAAFDVYSLLFINRLLTTDEMDRAETVLGGYAGIVP